MKLDAFTAAENEEWTTKLNSSFRACGCPASAAAMMAALAGYLLYVALTKGFASSGWLEIGIGFLLLLAATGIGKVLGLAWARVRFTRQLKALVAATAARSAA